MNLTLIGMWMTSWRDIFDSIENIVNDEMSISRIKKGIEYIRQLSEFLIYSNRNGLTYFELFIERDVLNVFSKILDKWNNELSKQLIQTTSILIQNISNDQELFYIFSHPFLNKLISYNFDLACNDELVDYFISFLKMLSLKLNSSSIQFFYNKRFRDFPLYGVATNLYNHPESMVRTAARTITLTIYNLLTDEMLETILSLPHATYFINLAWHLRTYWMRIDDRLVENINFEDLRDEVEDINDILMYFQDIYHAGKPSLTRALSNSLLNFAYFPWLLGSFWMKTTSPEIRSFQASYFFLAQTFSIIKEPSLCNPISISLFVPYIPDKFVKWMKRETKLPKCYKEKYSRKTTSTNLIKYTEENLSLSNINAFINENWSFLNEIQDEYQELRLAYLSAQNEILSEEPLELKRKGIVLVANKLRHGELDHITKYHKALSLSIGRPIGMIEMSDTYNLSSPTDLVDDLLECLYDNSYDKFVSYGHYIFNNNVQFIQNFLKSKDDGLILLIWLVVYTFMNSEGVDPIILNWSNMFPIGKNRPESYENDEENVEEEKFPSKLKTNSLITAQAVNDSKDDLSTRREPSEFEENILKSYNKPSYNQEIIWMMLNLLCTDPPFRVLTFKLISNILVDTWFHSNLSSWLYEEDLEKLLYSFYNSWKNIKFWVKKLPSYEWFFDIFKAQLENYNFRDDNRYHKISKNPWALLPVEEEAHESSLPEYFVKPNESEVFLHIKDSIDRFLIVGDLIKKFKKSSNLDLHSEYPFKLEGRDVYSWNVNDIVTVEESQSLIMWSMMSGGTYNSVYIVLDPEYFILADLDHEDSYRKIRIKKKISITNTRITYDPKDSKVMTVHFYWYGLAGNWSYSYAILAFESR